MNKVHPSFLAVVFILSVAGYVLYMAAAENYIEDETAAFDAEYDEMEMPELLF
jgi:hypothetical protein